MKIQVLRLVTLSVAMAMVAGSVGQLSAEENEGLGEIDLVGSLTKEPEYTCDRPLYALAVFGAEQERLMWVVLDKAQADGKQYNRIYVDANQNGDITEDGEMFKVKEAGGGGIRIPDIEIADDYVFSKISVRLSDSMAGIAMLNANFNDDLRLGGGYPVNSGKYMQLGETREEAPIVWFKPNESFEFQRWIERPLKIGGETDFKVFLGWQGKGHSSFCTTLGHILSVEEIVLATLEYKDAEGNVQFAECEFDQRC